MHGTGAGRHHAQRGARFRDDRGAGRGVRRPPPDAVDLRGVRTARLSACRRRAHADRNGCRARYAAYRRARVGVDARSDERGALARRGEGPPRAVPYCLGWRLHGVLSLHGGRGRARGADRLWRRQLGQRAGLVCGARDAAVPDPRRRAAHAILDRHGWALVQGGGPPPALVRWSQTPARCLLGSLRSVTEAALPRVQGEVGPTGLALPRPGAEAGAGRGAVSPAARRIGPGWPDPIELLPSPSPVAGQPVLPVRVRGRVSRRVNLRAPTPESLP